ncbi:MAG: hypothetical protein EA412_02030 [Chitinophagaceae bacterium]|nr:MAG: hypothetical protein EA412_02030 [Chitinophagaceae bacterium]
MKNMTFIFAFIFISIFVFEDVFSQTRAERREERRAEREERREWRKQAREYRRNPLEFRDKIEGYQEQISEQSSNIQNLEQELNQKEAMVDSIKTETQRIKQETIDPNLFPEGLSFQIQIGAFEKFNIDHYFNGAIFVKPEHEGNYNKYVIGYFTALPEAENFRKDMRKMGIRDAWIVPYFDGKRISDEAAENILGKPFRNK